jgi:peptidoglycan lytic transglycosylase
MKRIFVVLFLLLSMIACHGTKPPEAPPPEQNLAPQVFIGLASYYSEDLNGNQTASGEPYDPARMTAAHRTLPFGTRLLVTNLENNKSVLVTVTDRGPKQADRIIDVSLNAAAVLEMLPVGVVKVRIEVLNE